MYSLNRVRGTCASCWEEEVLLCGRHLAHCAPCHNKLEGKGNKVRGDTTPPLLGSRDCHNRMEMDWELFTSYKMNAVQHTKACDYLTKYLTAHYDVVPVLFGKSAYRTFKRLNLEDIAQYIETLLPDKIGSIKLYYGKGVTHLSFNYKQGV